jgi:hypothetical protein
VAYFIKLFKYKEKFQSKLQKCKMQNMQSLFNADYFYHPYKLLLDLGERWKGGCGGKGGVE